MPVAIDYLYREAAPVLGLAVAVNGFLKAWLQHSAQPRFLCHTADAASFRHFTNMARAHSKTVDKPCFQINPHGSSSQLQEMSCLFVTDPDLTLPVWRRGQIGGGAYATCGLVHSMSGDQVTRAVAELSLAPTHGADALICPSRAIQSAVRRVWELQQDYLNNRFGCSFACPVQTPIIPIGIDTEAFAAKSTPALRVEQRARLNAQEEDVMILFTGRLNFATKAHPLPLLLAAQKAAQQTRQKIKLVFYGPFQPQQEMESRFRAIVQDFGGTPLETEFVSNTDQRFPHGLWAAADIFASLIDNVQESFGLTPIEAMACGLPVVVSDWDGYRDSVRHGLDGLLIPTVAPPLETGQDIAAAFFNDRHYGRYLMGASQSTFIDIDAAAKAFASLASNKTKRLDMGHQAQARARSVYDWRVIIPIYEQLWNKLSEDRLRYASSYAVPKGWQALSPAHPNPLRIFESFPSATLGPEDKLIPRMAAEELDVLLKHDMNLFVPELLLPALLIREMNGAIQANGGLWIKDILAVTPESEKPRVWRTLGWLLKHGACGLKKGG